MSDPKAEVMIFDHEHDLWPAGIGKARPGGGPFTHSLHFCHIPGCLFTEWKTSRG